MKPLLGAVTAVRATCAHQEGEHHDCALVDALERLVPEACRMASDETGVSGPHGPRGGAWSRHFHLAMDVLAKKAGLRRLRPGRRA